MEYSINKGIGKNVEFKGLQAQYLIIFAVGLLGIFFLFAMLYLLSNMYGFRTYRFHSLNLLYLSAKQEIRTTRSDEVSSR